MVSPTLRNTLVLGACCASGRTNAFAPPSSSKLTTALHSEPRPRGEPSPRGRSLPDPFAPSPRTNNANAPPPPGPRRSFDEPPNVDLNGQVVDRQSNLFHRRTPSVNEDPRGFDMSSRYSQPPNRMTDDDQSMQPRKAWWELSPNTSGRIQGGSRHTYDAPFDRDASHVFMESDGRPLDVEFELWDGPNNTPTKMKVYSEDGRLRPINLLTENPVGGSFGGSMRGNTVSVRNTGPMEFPINAGVRSVGGGFSSPSGIRPSGGLAGSEGAYLTERDLNGFTRPASPSMSRGETVQGGALRTFPLDYSVEAVQVTITTDGYPMNAKVELWGTSSHIKQLAEIYNDNGQTRPFAAIIDVPGGSNTIAVYNTGPMEYPIKVVVEPVARTEGWDGKEEKFGGHLAPW